MFDRSLLPKRSTSRRNGNASATAKTLSFRLAATAVLVFLLAAYAGAAFGQPVGPSSVPGENPNAVAAPIVTGTAGDNPPDVTASQPAPGATLPPSQAQPIPDQPVVDTPPDNVGPRYVPGEDRNAVAPPTVTGKVERP